MKYYSAETIQNAKFIIKGAPDTLQAAYIHGWNECIEALINHAPAVEIEPDGFLQALREKRDAQESFEEEYRAAVEILKHKDTDALYVDYPDPGIPDCEECSFPGLLTED